MPPRAGSLRLLTLNVNGLKDAAKAARLFYFLQSTAGDPDVVILQEVKLSAQAALEQAMQRGQGPGLPYVGSAYCSLFSDTARGVAVLVREGGVFDGPVPDSAVRRDSEGRFVSVDLPFLRHTISVCCAYAPNSGQGAFFSSLQARLPVGGLVVMGGDFNCVLDPVLDEIRPRAATGPSNRTEGAAELASLVRDSSLVDAYRLLHPGGTEVSHFSTLSRDVEPTARSAARLDRWYVSSACSSWVTAVEHLPCYVSADLQQVQDDVGAWSPGDHCPVLLTLSPPGMPSVGPGRRTFPTHVLHDPESVAHLLSVCQPFVRAAAAGAPPAVQPGAPFDLWLRVKRVVLDEGIRRARLWRKAQQAVLQQAACQATEAWPQLPAVAGGGGTAARARVWPGGCAGRMPCRSASRGGAPAAGGRRACGQGGPGAGLCARREW